LLPQADQQRFPVQMMVVVRDMDHYQQKQGVFDGGLQVIGPPQTPWLAHNRNAYKIHFDAR
jgi:hypothetical protein